MSQLSKFFEGSRLIELGKIKIGGKSAKVRTTNQGREWRAPEKHDHFTVTTLHRDPQGLLIEDTELMAQLCQQYADPDGKLRQIPIRVLSNEIDDILRCAYVWYGGATIGARSDGETVTWFNDRNTGQRLPEPFTEPWKPEYLELKRGSAKMFKLHTNFACVIAAKEARWGGVYLFRTTSVISSRQLYSTLLHIHQLTGGMLVGMPLTLAVRPIQVSPEGKPTTVYVVHVELRGPDMQQLQMQAVEQARFHLARRQEMQAVQVEYRKLLPAPGMESAREAADINEEFSPETVSDTVQKRPEGEGDSFWEGVAAGKALATPVDSAPAEPVDAEIVQEPTPAPTLAQESPSQVTAYRAFVAKAGPGIPQPDLNAAWFAILRKVVPNFTRQADVTPDQWAAVLAEIEAQE